MSKLSGKTALVTSGAFGLGREFALRLALLGADVAVLDTVVPPEMLETIRALGVKACKVEGDIGNPEFVIDAISNIEQQLGEISVCVCDSDGFGGDFESQTALTSDMIGFDALFDKNVKGMMNVVRAVAPTMKKNRYGKIVTVSSHTGIESLENGANAQYGAAMAAVRSFTASAAAELGPHGITVNCIAPGWIELPTVQLDRDRRDYCIATTSLGRMGTPADCAGVLEFLVTELSGFVTGTTIEVTGGTTKKQ